MAADPISPFGHYKWWLTPFFINPLPFCPPAWASPPKLLDGRTAGLFGDGFNILPQIGFVLSRDARHNFFQFLYFCICAIRKICFDIVLAKINYAGKVFFNAKINL